MNEYSNNLMSFIDSSPTSFHAVENAVGIIERNNFKKLNYNEKWILSSGMKYYTIVNNSTLVTFILPALINTAMKYCIIGTHTDSPCIKIKPDASISFEDNILKFNTEIYGGPLLYTWFDRSLSIAGIVTYKSDTVIKSTLINYKQPIAVIPSIAIHLNKDVNQKGIPISNQKDIIPIVSLINKEDDVKNYLIKNISEKINIDYKDILDYELSLYDTNCPVTTGFNNEMISSSRLDNLSMFYNSIEALSQSNSQNNSVSIAIGFDNEEVGSKSKKGADSVLTSVILERIWISSGLSREDFLISSTNSFIISADLSHAVHPNSPDKTDPVSKNLINNGIVIKYNYNQKYSTDTESISKIVLLCKENNIPFQKFVNNSDFPGGSTIGPHISSALTANCVDIGVPALAMHSIRELAGVKDMYNSLELMKLIYNHF